MKSNKSLAAILTALLLGTGLSVAHAASLLADGDFDSLPVGTAPDVGTPAGHWFWPADHLTAAEYLGERAASQVSIVPAPGGGTGNCLHLSLTATEWPDSNVILPNLLGRSVTKASGEILHVSFDIYVEPGRGGGLIWLGTGPQIADRGPQMGWSSSGALNTFDSSGVATAQVSSYLRAVWQTVRLEVDLAHDRYNFYWGERGRPVSVIRSNLTFRAGSIPYIDRFSMARIKPAAPLSFLDNLRVSAGEPAAVVPGQSVAPLGGSLTLSLTNTLNVPSTYQWQFNGTNLPGATSSNLALSGLTLDQSGSYSVTDNNEYEVVTSQPATLIVQVTPIIIQAPLSQNVVAGGSVTFSIEITGNPAPFLYQWRQGSTVLANLMLAEKRAFFTLNNVQPDQGGTYHVVITNAALPTLTMNATWNLAVLPDTDGDGLPDAWETAYGLNLADASDAPLDGDGDSLSNLAEYRSGTSPTTATSLLKLETAVQDNGLVQVSFAAASNQTYTVEWSAQPAAGSWFKLADIVARPNDRMESVIDSNAGDPGRFYHVVTPRNP